MNRKVLLVEPNYKNKYPPIGLMKLATYFRWCQDDVRFFKGDLKLFAAQLLCEEFFACVPDFKLGKYAPKLVEFIRTGKSCILADIPCWDEYDLNDDLMVYRLRYVRHDFPKFDIIGVTTLFTFYWSQTVDTINYVKKFCAPNGQIIVGGIAATLQPDEMFKETGIRPYEGLLDKPGAIDDGNPLIIDELPLDYSILNEIDYSYPASGSYFGYMTRGCIRNCAFCAVRKLEPEYKDYIPIKGQLSYVDEHFGRQRNLLLMDNNVFASKCFDQIIDEIKSCGFEKGATYIPSNEYESAIENLKSGYNIRGYIRQVISIYDRIAAKLSDEDAGTLYLKREELGLLYPITATVDNILVMDELFRPIYSAHFRPSKRARYIDFNQGMDARLATPERMRKLSEVNIRPLRIAFDHYEQRETYCAAIRTAVECGITDLSNYLLYNFEDQPDDLYYRLRINVDLCEELGATIYSFPMKYHPIFDPEYFRNRDYIGKHWNRKFIRAIQAILNSTKGKIGKGIEFFEQAFGRDIDEYHRLLWMPETFIIFRRKYDSELRRRLSKKYTSFSEDDNDLANEWWREFSSLPEEKLAVAKSIISRNRFERTEYECADPDILHLLSYYEISR